MKTTFILAAGIVLLSAVSATAQGPGPVAKQCAADIQSFCAGKVHGAGQVRACLETNRDKVSADCRQALDTTGPGRGRRFRQ
jgi:Cysteine rich repeat